MMRWNPLCRLAPTLILLLPAVTFAYTIETPETMEDVLRVFNDEIPAELGAMQCGGWVPGVSVGEEPGEEGFITKVEGVPGRASEPLGDILSGLGVRKEEGGNDQFNDGYEYPQDALGLSTRCPTETDLLPKVHWSYTRATWMDTREVENLYFEDPPCVWRPGHAVTSPHSPRTCQEFCDILNHGEGYNLRYQYIDCKKIVGGAGALEPNDEDHLDGDGNERPDKQELTCELWCFKNSCTDGWTDLCDPSLKNLSTLIYGPDNEIIENLKEKGLEEAPTQPDGLPDSPDKDPDGDGQISIESKFPNCQVCEGEECRCGYQDAQEIQNRADPREKIPACLIHVPNEDIGMPDELDGLSDYSKKIVLGCRLMAFEQLIEEKKDIELDNEDCVRKFEEVVTEDTGDPVEDYKKIGINLMPGEYASFYRSYEAAYARAALTEVAPDDDSEGIVDVACYGFYRELDHRVNRMDDKPGENLGDDDVPWDNRYRRCVVNMDLSKRIETQAGKGAYGLGADFPENDEALGPPSDVWTEVLRGFSLMSPARTRNVSQALLRLNTGGTTAVSPIPRDDDERLLHDLADGSTTRAFDDTGSPREIVTWWQETVNRAAEVAAPPTLHLLLPPSWVFGLDNGIVERERSPASVDAQERRLQSVDVQIGAVPGALDEVVKKLEESLLFQLEEESVGIVVFSASPEELRALGDAHCLRAMQRTNQNVCDSALTSEERRVRGQLLKYADAAEKTRALRSELAAYATALVQSQKDLLEPVRTWLDNHRAEYDLFLAQRTSVLAIAREWDKVEAEMAAFPNTPYCMNHRFTPPIFSLPDPGLESRKALPGIEKPDTDPPWEMPTLPQLPRMTDAVLDLSMLRLQPTTVPVPVLKPIVWRLNLRAFAPGKTTYPPLADPPTLDGALNAVASARGALPSVCSPSLSAPGCLAQNPPDLILPTLLSGNAVGVILTAMDDIKEKIRELSVTYGRFWQAAGPLYPEDAAYRENNDGTYTLLDPLTGRTAAGNLSWWLKQGGGGWSSVDQVVAALKPALECEDWNMLPCGYTENDLQEEIARLNSRPMAELDEDWQSAGTIRMHAGACISSDEVCRILTGEARPSAQGWQIEAPLSQRTIPNIQNRIRNEQLPSPLGETNAASLPPYDVLGAPGDELAPALFIPTDSPLRPASSSTSSSPAL